MGEFTGRLALINAAKTLLNGRDSIARDLDVLAF
jgi:hypothetical protein